MRVPNRDRDEERMIKLEETVAHQEQLLDHLNTALTQLRVDLDTLRSQSGVAEAQIQWLLENRGHDQDAPHEKPPHY